MSVVKRPNSKNWYSEFILNGKKHIKSTKTTNKALASKIDQQYYQEAVEQQKLGGNVITLKAAFELYLKSQEDTPYKKLLHGIFNWMNINMKTDVPLTKIDTRFLYKFVELRSVDCELSTVKYNLGCIKRVIKHSKKLGYDVSEFDVPEVKVKNTKTRTLTLDEQERLLREFKSPDVRQGLGPKVRKDLLEWHGVCLMLFDLGTRISEILELKWEQLNFDDKLILVWRKKTSSTSVLPMSERIFEYLSNRERTHEYVFPNNELTNHRRYSSAVFKAACERAGIEGCVFHTIRHTAISRLAQKGLSMNKLQIFSGHSSINSLQRYVHLTSGDVVEEIRSLIN